jgi:hypothetical protein
VLEPSAGEGAIAEAILSVRINVVVHCVESDPVRAAVLADKGFDVDCADFLSIPPSIRRGPLGRVLMNPPFAVEGNPTAYVDHVRHAWNFLAPGGRLVAICPSGFTFAQTSKLCGFREWVAEHGTWTPLDEGAFRESGTSVNTCMVVLDKPL